jgi:hypothetical protein
MLGISLPGQSVPQTGTPYDANSDAPSRPTPIQAPVSDSWHPHEATILGKLADAFLQSRGMAPAFTQRVNEQNIHEAIGDFASDPLRAISRLAQIPGQELNAIKLYQQYQNSAATNESKAIRDSAKKDLIYNRVGAMLQASNAQTYPAMKKQVENYVRNVWNMDPAELQLPDEYDPAQISAITMGAIKPGDVMKEEGKNARQDKSLSLREQQQQELMKYRQQVLGLRQQQLNDANARAAASRQAYQDRFNQLHPKTKIVQTPNGEMELSPSGVTGRIGNQIWQKIAPGQWQRIK